MQGPIQVAYKNLLKYVMAFSGDIKLFEPPKGEIKLSNQDKELTMMDLIVEAHIGLERQGPGSTEITLKALSFIDEVDKITKTADLGCGTGGQTILLAQKISGEIIGVDQFAAFTDVLDANAAKLRLGNRVKGLVGNIEELPFQRESLDLIWSEGVIDGIGFQERMICWNSFLKQDGHLAFTCPTWLAEEHPAEVVKFWSDAGCELNTADQNIAILQKAGFCFIAAFVLPDTCWMEQYYIPRTAAMEKLREKYAGNETFEEYAQGDRIEIELYEKYKQHYGYVFYIAKKI